tara:strand:- start:115 stop:414 length:300 start_codon:yes stop_codon:yes gene_type:complete
MAIGIVKSILEIKSDAQVSINAEDINQITWHDGNPTNITNQQITDKQSEIEIRDAHIDPRVKAYPSIEDQLDMQFHDQVNDTTTWKDGIQAIKDANPKS